MPVAEVALEVEAVVADVVADAGVAVAREPVVYASG